MAALKIVTVVGARPQFVKAAVVSRALRKHKDVEEILVHTGQHYDDNMSAVFFREMEIPTPKYSLGVGSGLHGWQTGRMLEEIEKVLLKEKPGWVLVFGDTNSTLAGALAAAKLHMPVAHVEAGLRSFNRRMPEEVNRVLTDHASSLLFAPTEVAVANLRKEGIDSDVTCLVGDVMYDAVLWYAARADDTALRALQLRAKEFILATIHRAENTDHPANLAAIIDGLNAVARDVPVVWPVHPRTRARIQAAGLGAALVPALHLVEPLGYLQMIALEKAAGAIVTDSGGVQKEAFFFHVPCCTLRAETEWTELVAEGWNRLVAPVSAAAVSQGILATLGTSGTDARPYGSGDAADRIATRLAGGH